MKITCQSCQSKYNVADEKVQGKIVKIRCRKCGGTIVVNATSGGGTNGARAVDEGAAPGLSPSGTGEWHVNLGDTDQRQMSMADLVAAYNSGAITQATFIWTDGMDDWKPLAEVDAVVNALHATAAQPSAAASYDAPARNAYDHTAPAYEPPAPAAYEAPAAAYAAAAPAATYAAAAPAATYAAPAAAAAYAAPAPEAKRAAVKREARGRDLFSTQVGDDIQTSAAASAAMSQPADDGRLTGQRNENSVLFSLAVLTKNAEDRAPGAEVPSKDDSGMIDLRALVAKAETNRPAAARLDGEVFAPPLGFAAPALSGPLASPLGASAADVQGKSKAPLLIGAGGGIAVLLALGIFIGVRLAGGSAAPSPTASAAASNPAMPSASATTEATASAAAPEPSATPSASVATTATKPKGAAGAWHPPSGGKQASGGSSPSPGAAAALPPSPAPKKGGGDCGCNGDLMCLMKCSTH